MHCNSTIASSSVKYATIAAKMAKRSVTSKQQLLNMLHGRPLSEEELQQEADKRSLKLLQHLHKVVGKQIAIVEQVHKDHQSDEAHRFAVGMLDIGLHKEIRCVERMIEEKWREHDGLYSTYTHIERRESFKAERRKSLVEILGSQDAETLLNAMERNNQHKRERDQQREKLQKKLGI